MTDSKPLHWTPATGIGYSVVRRPDGGMTLTFTDLSDATIQHWQNFALEHLLGAERLTRNLYDLRLVDAIPEKAIHAAIAVNSDPAEECGSRRLGSYDLLLRQSSDLRRHQGFLGYQRRRDLALPPARPACLNPGGCESPSCHDSTSHLGIAYLYMGAAYLCDGYS
jgi:hypothetical protein